MAIEDAYVLGLLLVKVESSQQLGTALKAFDAIRHQRGWNRVTTSAEAGTM